MSTDDALRDHVVLPIPKGVKVALHGRELSVQGPLGTAKRAFPHDALKLGVSGDEVTLTLTIAANRKRSQSLLHTWESHTKNLLDGVTKGFEAKMKAVAAHFPMKVAVKDTTLVIENFLGEKHPRSAPLLAGVAARVDGDFVVLEGIDIEQVGQSAANIERATHIRDYDPRVFQDGIYIVERAHVKESA
jgi:large subunit ribosomal protein L6